MYNRILVPVDGSPTSERALSEAIRLAKLCSGTIRLLHVVDPITHVTGFERPDIYASRIRPALLDAGAQLLAKASERVAAAGVPADTALHESISERVSEIVVEQARAWGAELIVIGTHGRRGIDRVLLGSDAEMVVRTSPVPVLLVRSQPCPPAM